MKRLFLFLFFILFLISCGSKKNVYKNRIPKGYDTGYQVSDSLQTFEESYVKGISHDYIVLENAESIDISMSPEDISNSINNLNKKSIVQIEDKSTSNTSTVNNTKNEKYVKGKIAYTIKDTMKVGTNYRIVLRITKEMTTAELVDNISDKPVKVIVENIRIGNIMNAVLIDPEGNFSILNLSSEEQNIEEHDYTEWSWNVKPLKSGECPLKLIIKVKIFTENGEFLKDIPVFDKTVNVNSNAKFTIGTFFQNNWSYLLSTIIIPFIIWLWNRRKKKEEK